MDNILLFLFALCLIDIGDNAVKNNTNSCGFAQKARYCYFEFMAKDGYIYA